MVFFSVLEYFYSYFLYCFQLFLNSFENVHIKSLSTSFFFSQREKKLGGSYIY